MIVTLTLTLTLTPLVEVLRSAGIRPTLEGLDESTGPYLLERLPPAAAHRIYRHLHGVDTHPNGTHFLPQLVASAHQLAVLQGYPTYGHLVAAASPRLAGDPEEVRQFLHAISRANERHVEDDLRRLGVRCSNGGGGESVLVGSSASSTTRSTRSEPMPPMPPPRRTLIGWHELPRLRYQASSLPSSNSTATSASLRRLETYLDLEGALEGVALVAREVLGLTLTPAPLGIHEAWVTWKPPNPSPERHGHGDGHDYVPTPRPICPLAGPSTTAWRGREGAEIGSPHPQLAKWVVTDERGADPTLPVGIVYLDLHPRPHKPRLPHVQVLSCGRTDPTAWRPGLSRADVLGQPQHPILLLSCSIPPGAPLSTSRPHHARPRTPLTMDQVRTLFHECGHALHWLASRTEHQHLSGTRGPPDFIEIPSHLWERFATDPSVLQRWVRLPSADGASFAPGLPVDLLAEITSDHHHARGVLNPDPYPALSLQEELVSHIVDQALFAPSEREGDDVSDPHGTVQRVIHAHAPGRPVPGTNPFLRFVHFADYPSTYYSYLVARAAADAIWERHFAADPFCPEAGRTLRDFLAMGASGNYAEQIRALTGGDAGVLPSPEAVVRRAVGR